MAITPAWLQNLTYDAQYDRLWAVAFGAEPGITKPLSYKVTPGSALSVNVAAGTALVRGSDIVNQGLYSILNTATVNVIPTTAHGSLTRVDLVILEVRDQASNGVANNDARVRVVAGTAGSGVPATPASCLVLAQLTITANMVTMTTGAIADKRTLGGLVGQIGDTKEWAGLLLPTGYDYADGGTILRATYAEYFELVGTTFGVGNGSTTFAKPDYRGRRLEGMDNMGTAQGAANRNSDAQADIKGGAAGTEVRTLIEANMPAHAHAMPHTHTITPLQVQIPTFLQLYGSGVGFTAAYGGTNTGTTSQPSTPNTGNGNGVGTPLDIKSPWISLPIIVKVQ